MLRFQKSIKMYDSVFTVSNEANLIFENSTFYINLEKNEKESAFIISINTSYSD